MIDKKILIKSVKNALKEDCVNKDLTHKVLGKEALKKIKYLDKSQYVLRPDYINTLRMLIN